MLDDLPYDRFQWHVSPLPKMDDDESLCSGESTILQSGQRRKVEKGSLDLLVFCKDELDAFEEEEGGESGMVLGTTTTSSTQESVCSSGARRQTSSRASHGTREVIKKIWISLQPPVVRDNDGTNVVETKRSEVALFAVEVPEPMEFRKSTLRRAVISQAKYKSIYAEKIGQNSELFYFQPSRGNAASRIETTDQLWNYILKPSSKYQNNRTESLLNLGLGRINMDAGDEMYDHHISAFDSDHGAGPDSQDYMHKTQSAVRASPAKKQVLSREGAGAASRSSYRDALSFLRSVYKLDDDANPYYHGFSAEMEHQFIITWETMGDVGGTFSRIVCQEMGVGAFLGQMK